MRPRLLVSIAVPVAAFSVTFLILLMESRVQDSVRAPPAAQVHGQVAPERGRAVNVSAQPGAQPIAPAAAAPAPPPAASAASSAAEMPVKFMARPARGEVKTPAALLNVSDESMDVTVTAVNPQTHMRSVVQSSLLAHQRLNLTEAGLTVSSGDEVTLQSPPYRDIVVRVP